MYFEIDTAAGLSINEQMYRQVLYAVASGTLQTGDRVPSVRELSRLLAINPNTVARAYRELQADGVLESVRGLGLEVASGAQKFCKARRLEFIRGRLRQVFKESRQGGFTTDQIQQMVAEELAKLEANHEAKS